MSLTQDCLTTHIKYIQCLYKDLADTYVNKLKIGKVCEEAERNLLIVNEYLESLYCFIVPDEYINKYRIAVVFTGETSLGDEFEITDVVFTLTDGTLNYTITLTGTYTTLTDGGIAGATQIREDIVTELEAIGFNVTSNVAPYIYFQSEDTTYEGLTLTGLTYTINQVGGSDAFGVAMNDNGSISEEDIIDNCLTTDEICCMISHTYKLLKDCNC